MSATALQPQLARSLQLPGSPPPSGLQAPAGVDLAQRWAVHRNTFLSSLVDAHAAAYPVTAALVGRDCFHGMARARVLADPPRSPVLTEYVQEFPGFVASWPATRGLPYLAEVSGIEALCVRAHHAADADAMNATDYQQLRATPQSLARLMPRLHPAAFWLDSRHAACSLWQAHQGVPDPADADLRHIDTGLAEDVLVTRPQFVVRVVLLPIGGIALLDALQGGRSLGEAFAFALACEPRADLARLFSLLIDHGLLVQPPQPSF